MQNNGTQRYPRESGSDSFGVQSSIASRDLLARPDTNSGGSQYLLQHQHGLPPVAQNAQVPHFDSTRGPPIPTVRFTSQGGSTRNNQQMRRRISRACDSCNLLRTKCDGRQPCAHCEELALTCAYERAKKKRGKAPKKDVTTQQIEATVQGAEGVDSITAAVVNNDTGERLTDETKQAVSRGTKRKRSRGGVEPPSPPAPAPTSQQVSITAQPVMSEFAFAFPNAEQLNPATSGGGVVPFSVPRMASAGMAEQIMRAMNSYGSAEVDDYQPSNLYPQSNFVAQHPSRESTMPDPMVQNTSLNEYGEPQYGVALQASHQGIATGQYVSESPLSNGLVGPPAADNSPGWVPQSSSSAVLQPGGQDAAPNQTLRYPVLEPLLPYLADIITIDLACDLLEWYFTSTSSVYLHPQSPYILGYVFRKRSFLRLHDPRPCSPALLSSMLWVAAQTSDSAILNSPPSARGSICQKLLEVTIQHLNPLVHAPAEAVPSYGGSNDFNNVALGGFGVALPGQAQDMEGGSPGASGCLDDVATYLHLATVVSASEYKAASLRWWNAAWSLARELKLGKELPYNLASEDSPAAGNPQDPSSAITLHQTNGHSYRVVHEEEREERRRVWWLLYAMDRHLALCYNRPLFFLDSECADLLQPVEHIDWQAGEYYRNGNDNGTSQKTGPPLECYGQSVFGYFLPLMTILGEIVELKQARDHPRFGLDFHRDEYWTSQVQGISWQLEAYGESLKRFATENTGTQHVSELGPAPTHTTTQEWGHFNDENVTNQSSEANHISQRMQESNLRTKIVVLYGTYLMHTLHILLNGKWDPISLLDNDDQWISTPSFISATGHAVSASEALEGILEYDPDLSYMPFFFGIYLLQGSFLLLLIADKLQDAASPRIIKACETIVRAHEACIVTLSTEYQRNFRKVMRSALAQVRGRIPEDVGEGEKRRRKVLALYRWTGDGTGLAL